MKTIKEKLNEIVTNDEEFSSVSLGYEIATNCKNWPYVKDGESLDCENCEIVEIKEYSMIMWASGDWQIPEIIHVEMNEKDKLICVKHDETSRPDKTLSEEELKVLLFDILPLDQYLNHLATIYDKSVTQEEFEEIFLRVESEIHKIKGDNAFIGLQVISNYTNRLIEGADHDIIFSTEVDNLIKAGILVKDVIQLRKLNWMIQDGGLACFV